ncbi:glycosyl transferase family 2 [Hydrogenispora ethanolica]|uniref:Glycosyl transferase family 2 n=1 Tax=Hydrogenispora ethanolica TaxID=1082276 RepID=A0A4R1R470_HYDET|nr:glycosyltransferase [Hydrogenispora ethanolica]TCL60281.1 glycosyl transferase family 2 [Hydrogenispora ethanolica]
MGIVTYNSNQYGFTSTSRSLVSVIIPVYNHEEFVGQAIQSVLSQNYNPIEILVVDDGSTDNTRKIVQSFGSHIRYIYKNNGGTSSALNVGIKSARGNYICWLSSDDLFLQTKVQKQIRMFQIHSGLGMIYTDWYETDENANITKLYRSPELLTRREAALTLLKGNCINGSTIMVKAECFKKVGYFKENYIQAHDHEMWLRLCRYYRFGHIHEPLLLYRRHHKNLSLQPDPDHERHHFEMYQEAKAFFRF